MFELKDKTLNAIISASPVGMMLVDDQGTIVFANHKLLEIFKYTSEQLYTLNIEDLVPTRYRQQHIHIRQGFNHYPVARPIDKKDRLLGLTSCKQEVPLEIGLSPIELDKAPYILCTIIDRSDADRVAQLKLTNQQLQKVATHDCLTGLTNRRLFNELMDKLLSLAARNHTQLTLMFVDLDDFKQVNDQFGHDTGDSLLIEVAKVMQSAIRKSDVLSRIGGDEFVICLNETHSPLQLKRLTTKLLNDIAAIDDIKGYPIHISASIGVVSVTVNEQTRLANIMRQADKLMYQAKSEGKGRAVCAAC